MSTHRQRVLDEVMRRGLVSMMNDTKWLELREAVQRELPFCPPFQLKCVLDAAPYPGGFEVDVAYLGDWSNESLWPFYGIEWMRIRPRYYRAQGHDASAKLSSVEAELLEIVKRYQIPHRREGESIWIFGYATAEFGPA